MLKWEDVDIGEPKEGEIRVKNKAIGLNFIDVYYRKGVYKTSTMPFIPGFVPFLYGLLVKAVLIWVSTIVMIKWGLIVAYSFH